MAPTDVGSNAVALLYTIFGSDTVSSQRHVLASDMATNIT
jgi:hypothetical protein